MGFKANITYAIRGITREPNNALTVQISLSLRDEQYCLLCEFISPEVLVINLFAHLRIFLVGLGNSSEFLGRIEVSEKI